MKKCSELKGKNKELTDGLDDVKEQLWHIQKVDRPQFLRQRLNEVKKQRNENWARIKELEKELNEYEMTHPQKSQCQSVMTQTSSDQVYSDEAKDIVDRRGPVTWTCGKHECVQATAEIIELRSEVQKLINDNHLLKREQDENSYWVDNQFELMGAVDNLQKENNNLKEYLE